MSFSVGSLVRARGREWVVLPDSVDDLLILRPLGGTDDEVTGIYLPLETVAPAEFALPDPNSPGDHRSARLLRDAVRLGFRSSAGPFRSFARLGLEPRPYQLVPLLMALKMNPIRLLIADDVGIGKTIEACLVARELMDRGEVQRMAVLCPPHLAEQWQSELRDKFHIDAELVLPGTAHRLEKKCRVGQVLFEVYNHVIVSTDFIKSDRRRDDFLRTCPELVIVDEAHTAAYAGEGRGGRQQRNQLVSGIAAKPNQHLILVTATPHSGKDEAFRSLLKFLDPGFAHLPNDLTGPEHEHHRRELAKYFVQRRRADIKRYMETDTFFPDREEGEETYKLSPEYQVLFNRVLDYARETVQDRNEPIRHQRVRWWSALALLRALASSPAAAAATLRNRAASADTDSVEEADEIGRRTVLDLIDDESSEGIDVVHGSNYGADEQETQRVDRRLRDMARQAETLRGAKDFKLQKAIALVERLVKDGFNPIVFCRFIPTAEYVAEALRDNLKGVEVAAVTGTLPPAEREARVMELGQAPKRVLVATDCLSEGINLQQYFNAVMHYDLSWNPTRHEQREGRVDRYGQPDPKVRVLTYYGIDNQIDGIVIDVLIRKHRTIRNMLGISVPVPIESDQFIEAIFEGLLLREKSSRAALQLGLFEELLEKKDQLHTDWDNVAEREKRSRTMFAQQTIKVDEVARELEEARRAVGSGVDVARFIEQAVRIHGGTVSKNGAYEIDLTETPRALRDVIGLQGGGDKIRVRFELPVQKGELYLTRTHPFVEGLATYVMDSALDGNGKARRAGVIRTLAVERRTTLLIVRFRYHLIVRRADEEQPLLTEDVQLLAFRGAPGAAEWLSPDEAEALLAAEPVANIMPDLARAQLGHILEGFGALRKDLDEAAMKRGEEILDAHRRVREAAKATGRYRIEPRLPPDVLGLYVFLPAGT